MRAYFIYFSSKITHLSHFTVMGCSEFSVMRPCAVMRLFQPATGHEDAQRASAFAKPAGPRAGQTNAANVVPFVHKMTAASDSPAGSFLSLRSARLFGQVGDCADQRGFRLGLEHADPAGIQAARFVAPLLEHASRREIAVHIVAVSRQPQS